MENEKNENPQERNQTDPKAYHKPAVAILGKLEDLTQKIGGSVTDGVVGSLL